MARKYYSLLIRDNSESPWQIEFGDYDRETVIDERLCQDIPKKHMKIITTGDKTADIVAAVDKLNAGTLNVNGVNFGPAVQHADGSIEAGPHIK